MSFAIKRVIGAQDTNRVMDALKVGVRNRILRKATRKAASIINKLAKSRLGASNKASRKARRKASRKAGVNTPRWPTGAMRKSIGIKTYTSKRNASVGVIGPRRGFKIQVGTRTDGRPIFHDPANIAHLVEYGHGGPHPAPPHPFMRPAWDQGARPAFQVYRQELTEGIAKIARERAKAWSDAVSG